MKEYKVVDINKGLFADDTYVKAKSPMYAAKEYLKSIGENKKVKRDISARGRLLVCGSKASYVYEVE